MLIILLLLIRDFKILLIKCDNVYNASVNVRSWDIINAVITITTY